MSETRARLEARAAAYRRIRDFFADRGVIEVHTPTLSRAATSDPALSSLSVLMNAPYGRCYLRTSPEHALKRLLAGGSGDIYELGRVWRDDEIGRWHQPEFELLEWYRLGFSAGDLMDEVYALLLALLESGPDSLPRRDLRYAEAFAGLGIDPHAFDTAAETRLRAALRQRDIDAPTTIEGNALLDLALATAIVPAWPRQTAVFLTDYPASQAALAVIDPGPPPIARRFEVFIDGIELGNGFCELTDAAEQRTRFEHDLARRRALGLPELPLDEAFLAALESGLPACAGVAVGVDRLLALGAGADALAPVLNFPH